jgi:hypothetical protein
MTENLLKTRMIAMAWQLNDLVVDLKTPVDIMAIFKDVSKTNLQSMALSRMVLSAVFVNLCKLLEIINHYGKDIKDLPDNVGPDLNKIKVAIEEKGIYAYRSTYIAHAFIQEKGHAKRALTLDEATSALMRIIDKGLSPPITNAYVFCDWIYSEGDQTCVVNTLHRTVLAVQKQFGALGNRI